eukprot:CAMPEP_0119345732 /NCGR_PEP_ID=MMETSP1333-20130426/107640_1 /TAXON_ID=418940 /ORGANISM="Scyphosphaera apsteinii, Strain RCC1455" /LENGTH=200 /DNA_ID=CAMNT_0007358213 /DNA_START=6 /DNA_END=608 /DNA_ORIENTATION=-
MENQLFNLKFTAKQLNRMSSKCTKQERDELIKVKKAMEKGNMDTARIYGQNSIRIRNQGNGYLRLASRVDAVASRLESAIQMQQVTRQMGGVVKGMDKILQSMDMKQISSVMDQFERAFDEIDLRAQYVEGAIDNSTALQTPDDEVEMLLNQVSDEHGLAFKANAANASRAPVKVQQAQQGDELGDAEDALEKRLAALRS